MKLSVRQKEITGCPVRGERLVDQLNTFLWTAAGKRLPEVDKIECGKRHFVALGVDYDVATCIEDVRL